LAPGPVRWAGRASAGGPARRRPSQPDGMYACGAASLPGTGGGPPWLARPPSPARFYSVIRRPGTPAQGYGKNARPTVPAKEAAWGVSVFSNPIAVEAECQSALRGRGGRGREQPGPRSPSLARPPPPPPARVVTGPGATFRLIFTTRRKRLGRAGCPARWAASPGLDRRPCGLWIVWGRRPRRPCSPVPGAELRPADVPPPCSPRRVASCAKPARSPLLLAPATYPPPSPGGFSVPEIALKQAIITPCAVMKDLI
jgi:hypothetical protein